MEKHFVYKTSGVCSREINFDLVDGCVKNVVFVGGCRGNTQGVAALAEGMQAEEIIRRCSGINCRDGNSCPNELAKAVQQCLAQA